MRDFPWKSRINWEHMGLGSSKEAASWKCECLRGRGLCPTIHHSLAQPIYCTPSHDQVGSQKEGLLYRGVEKVMAMPLAYKLSYYRKFS